MKIQYEFTLADMAEVMRRGARRSKPWLTWRWRRRALESAIYAVVAYLILWRAGLFRAPVAVATFVAGYFFPWALKRGAIDNAYRQHFRKAAGGDGPFQFKIEITEDALLTTQLGATQVHPWSSITGVANTQGGIEFHMRDNVFIFIRDDAFDSAAQRSQFLQLARRHAAAAYRTM